MAGAEKIAWYDFNSAASLGAYVSAPSEEALAGRQVIWLSAVEGSDRLWTERVITPKTGSPYEEKESGIPRIGNRNFDGACFEELTDEEKLKKFLLSHGITGGKVTGIRVLSQSIEALVYEVKLDDEYFFILYAGTLFGDLTVSGGEAGRLVAELERREEIGSRGEAF